MTIERNRLGLRRRGASPSTKDAVASSSKIETVGHEQLTWVNIENPGEKEIEFLRQDYDFHPLALDDTLSTIQVPKIDEYETYLFVVLHFPSYDSSTRTTKPTEIDLFVGENYVITLHNGSLRPLARTFREARDNEAKRQLLMGRSSGFLLYQILDRLIDYCFPILNRIIANINRVETEIFSKTGLDNVRELSVLRRDIISFRRVIKPQLTVLADLEHRDVAFLQEDLEAYFGDLADSMTKIWDTLEDYQEVVAGMNDASSLLTSQRLHHTTRVLTIITTLLVPLLVVAGVFGMVAVVVPELTIAAFAVALAAMALVLAAGLIAYRLGRWI